MRLLFVNYHYIREPSGYPYRGIHPVSRQAFSKQIDDLRQRFHIASPSEVEAFADGNDTLPGPSVFFTFDDGLAEHGWVANEVMDPRGIKAAFFVTSRPYLDRRAVTVHKIHWLRATTSPERFREELFALIGGEHRDKSEDPATASVALKAYPDDTPADAKLKYLVNYLLDADLIDEVTSQMLMDRNIAEADFCDELYLAESSVRALADAGHVIGAHGHVHRPFSSLTETELDADVRTNLSCLGKIVGRQLTWLSYPYGVETALPKDTEGFCRRHELRVALTMIRGWNDTAGSPTRLKRINTNEVAELAA